MHPSNTIIALGQVHLLSASIKSPTKRMTLLSCATQRDAKICVLVGLCRLFCSMQRCHGRTACRRRGTPRTDSSQVVRRLNRGARRRADHFRLPSRANQQRIVTAAHARTRIRDSRQSPDTCLANLPSCGGHMLARMDAGVDLFTTIAKNQTLTCLRAALLTTEMFRSIAAHLATVPDVKETIFGNVLPHIH